MGRQKKKFYQTSGYDISYVSKWLSETGHKLKELTCVVHKLKKQWNSNKWC